MHTAHLLTDGKVPSWNLPLSQFTAPPFHGTPFHGTPFLGMVIPAKLWQPPAKDGSPLLKMAPPAKHPLPPPWS